MRSVVSPKILAVLLIAGIFTRSRICLCEVLEVPAIYENIQSALNASHSGDTVLVAPGLYHEFLTCATNSLTLTGWHSGDTLAEFRTILDPIPGGIDTPSVAVLSGDTVTIEKFAFFNRAELRQPIWPTRVGGIEHTGNLLRVQNCRFDSVSKAVDATHSIHASSCDFVGCQWPCLYPSNPGVVQAEHCNFDGAGQVLVYGASGSTIQNCTFHRSSEGGTHLLQLYGHNLLVSGCRFSSNGRGFTPLLVSPLGSSMVTDCIFDSTDNTVYLIEVALNCPAAADTPIVISNCVFRHNHGGQWGGVTPIRLSCQTADAGYIGLVEHNQFLDNSVVGNGSPGVAIAGSASLINNTFENLLPINNADVFISHNILDTLIARGNRFLEPGIAAEGMNGYFDARENWWGDSTGPFHANLNPDGQGTEVGNGVEFIPWLTSPPDSVPDTTGSNTRREVGLPTEFALFAFPNPFNATTTMTIQVSKPGDYEVVLYDVTGRETARLFAGTVVAAHALQVSAEDFATGVYFARLLGAGGELAVTKLVLLK